MNSGSDIICCFGEWLSKKGHGPAEQKMQQFLPETACQSSNSCSEVLVWWQPFLQFEERKKKKSTGTLRLGNEADYLSSNQPSEAV